MPSRFAHGPVLAIPLLLALLACKLFKSDSEAVVDAAPTAEPAPTAAVEPTPAASAEAEPAAEPTAAKAPTGPAPTVIKDAGAADAQAAPDASAKAQDAGSGDAGAAKSSACQSKCQGVLQVCLTPGVTEAGLPTLADPTQCKAAFDACAAACK